MEKRLLIWSSELWLLQGKCRSLVEEETIKNQWDIGQIARIKMELYM
jgi:hypothetical protein